MGNILKNYKDVDNSNIDLYMEELIHDEDLWYRVVNDKIEFKDFRHNRLKSIQNYNDFEKVLRESYEQKQQNQVGIGALSESDGNEPRWKQIAIRYNGNFVKYKGDFVTYG